MVFSTGVNYPPLTWAEIENCVLANQKIQLIKHFRSICSSGLREAKDCIEAVTDPNKANTKDQILQEVYNLFYYNKDGTYKGIPKPSDLHPPIDDLINLVYLANDAAVLLKVDIKEALRRLLTPAMSEFSSGDIKKMLDNAKGNV